MALSIWIKSKCGRGLDRNNKLHLGYLAFSQDKRLQKKFSDEIDGIESQDYSKEAFTLSYAQFATDIFTTSKEGRPQSFSDWFFAAVTLIEVCLKQLWKDGHVMGFIGRSTAESRIRIKEEGTFLIRISDTKLGGVTIVHNGTNQHTGEVEVISCKPFFRRELESVGLEPRLYNSAHLVRLYRNDFESPIHKAQLNLDPGRNDQKDDPDDGYRPWVPIFIVQPMDKLRKKILRTKRRLFSCDSVVSVLCSPNIFSV